MGELTQDVGVSTLSPVAGSFFLSSIPGLMGRSVSAAQAFTRRGCVWTHAGISTGDGRIVQAEPAGVRVRTFPDWLTSGVVLWSDAPIQRHLAAQGRQVRQAGYEEELRGRVVEAALSLVDRPYAWLDYVTIVAAEWGMPGWQRLRARVDAAGGFLCSSLVDRAFSLVGVHMFTDKRPLGQVTPADLARYDEMWVRDRLAHLEHRVAIIEEKIA